MSILGICGNGYSGSGAVLDLLKEYDNCVDICGEKEFMFPYIPDGINDLYYHVSMCPARFQSSDIAIKRFRETINRLIDSEYSSNAAAMHAATDKFLDKVVQVEWDGYWTIDVMEQYRNLFRYVMFRLRRKAYSLSKQKIPMIKQRKMHLSVTPENFTENAKIYLEEIIKAQGDIDLKEQNVVLNQPFPSNNPQPFMDYFEDPKCIIVSRDPRDTYLLLKKVQSFNARWFPHDDVDSFIEYYKLLHKDLHKLKEKDNILLLRFEDLIYNYEESVSQIESFIGNLLHHSNPKKYFNPEISKNNTQLFELYTNYSEDIKKIEKELFSYLYDFSDKGSISHENIF